MTTQATHSSGRRTYLQANAAATYVASSVFALLAIILSATMSEVSSWLSTVALAAFAMSALALVMVHKTTHSAPVLVVAASGPILSLAQVVPHPSSSAFDGIHAIVYCFGVGLYFFGALRLARNLAPIFSGEHRKATAALVGAGLFLCLDSHILPEVFTALSSDGEGINRVAAATSALNLPLFTIVLALLMRGVAHAQRRTSFHAALVTVAVLLLTAVSIRATLAFMDSEVATLTTVISWQLSLSLTPLLVMFAEPRHHCPDPGDAAHPDPSASWHARANYIILLAPAASLGIMSVTPKQEPLLGTALGFVCLVYFVGEQFSRVTTKQRAVAEMYQKLSARDPLTGLANRRAWEAELLDSLEATDETGAPTSLIYLDLDHFKKFNDTYGHQAGDDALAETAATWSATAPACATVGRFGGEEFVVILPSYSHDSAHHIADTLRSVVPRGLTSSAGVATSYGGEDHRSLIRRADGALYTAKKQGRNRTVVDLGAMEDPLTVHTTTRHDRRAERETCLEDATTSVSVGSDRPVTTPEA